jgi:hypothetical protein
MISESQASGGSAAVNIFCEKFFSLIEEDLFAMLYSDES